MDDIITMTFDDDADDLGDLIFIDRKAFTEFTYAMNHTEEDEFNSHLDDLMEASNQAELAKYPFISFSKPADYDRKQYSMEPLGQEHAAWCAENEEAKTLTALSRAKHHYYLMFLCGHPEEIRNLQEELQMSPEDFRKARDMRDPKWAEKTREGIARTLRQVARMKRKYSATEIAEANAFLDDEDRGQFGDLD